MRTYRIICLKRSSFSQSDRFDYLSDWYKHCHIVYWRDNYSGYTFNQEEAGVYTAEQIESAGGKFMDWILEPIGWCE